MRLSNRPKEMMTYVRSFVSLHCLETKKKNDVKDDSDDFLSLAEEEE